MPIALSHEDANLYRLEIGGVLRKADLDRCQDALLAQMDPSGPARLLVVLVGFDGWEPQDNWNDLSFYTRHGDSIERMAIVGPERWRSDTMRFAWADWRKAPVKFFPEKALADARAWLAA